jgi:hypothetical protein
MYIYTYSTELGNVKTAINLRNSEINTKRNADKHGPLDMLEAGPDTLDE